MCCAFFMCRETTSGENPTERLTDEKRLRFLALCTLCNFADTLRRFAVYPRLHYAEHALLSHVINCTFDQTNAFYLFVCLLLVYSFSPRVHSIPRGPHILKKRIKMMCCFCCMGQFMGENPTERLAFGGCLQTLALCTVCNFADTLRRFAVYPRFPLCRARPVVPASHTSFLKSHYRSR